MTRVLRAAVPALLLLGLSASPTRAVVVRVPCQDCDSWPLWLQVGATVVGLGLALAVLYVPYRLAQRAATPQRRGTILVVGVVLLVVGLIVAARVLVVLFPD